MSPMLDVLWIQEKEARKVASRRREEEAGAERFCRYGVVRGAA